MRSVLDGFTPGDVIEAIGDETPRFALFTTFTFSPSSFAEQYLHGLQQSGCERIAVLVDSLGYAQSLDDAACVVGIGTDYVLRRVPSKGSFHAKLVVVQTATRTILGVGSGNLTVAGLICNAEVGGLSMLDHPEPRMQVDGVVRRLLSLVGLCAAPMPFVGPIAIGLDTWLLTTLDQPIAEQLSQIPTEIGQIELTSPFLDPSGRTMQWLRKRWPSAAVRLRVDPRYNSLTPRVLAGIDEDVVVQVPITNESAPCPEVHGKLCTWFGQDHAYVLLGSANFTAAGLLDRQNVEAAMLRRMDLRDARRLIKVPKVKWRRARADDASTSSMESVPDVSARVLVAELDGRRLKLGWQSKATGGVVRVLVSGHIALIRTIEGQPSGDGTVEAYVDLTTVEINRMAGPRVAELRLSDGSEHRGWIEVQDLLDAPPESKRRLRILDDLRDDPEGCPEDDLIQFLEWLRRGMQTGHLPTARTVARFVKSSSGNGQPDPAVDRKSLLEDRVPLWHARHPAWERLAEESFDAASATIRFFDVEQMETGESAKPDVKRPRPSAAAPLTTRNPIPPSVFRVLSELFRQMAVALAAAEVVDVIAAHLRQFPTCLKALKYCSTRWRVGTAEARHFVYPVVVACLAPGYDSVLKSRGVLTTLSAERCRVLLQFHGVMRSLLYLESTLLLLASSGDLERKDLVKDMAVALDTLITGQERSGIQGIWHEVWDVLASDEVQPDYDHLIRELSAVQGEVGLIRQRRESLLAAVNALKANKISDDLMFTLARQASSSDESARQLINLLSRISVAPGRLRLEEVERDETACPVCCMAIAHGDLARMNDATFVHQHSCETLLVRAIDS